MSSRIHADRRTVDLLFFPTGGGKTEAYLGLAAFTLIYRRFRIGVGGVIPKYAGVTVLMRYTLRLLTLDQLSRAAALVCALELMRQENPKELGTWPFEIGLWVGSGATPNYMGKPGDEFGVVSKVLEYKQGRADRPPVPLEKCPWCGASFTPDSFHLHPDQDNAEELRITCLGNDCDFTGDRIAADPHGGRADLSAAAQFPDRHGRQVRRHAVERRDRQALRPCQELSNEASGSWEIAMARPASSWMRICRRRSWSSRMSFI